MSAAGDKQEVVSRCRELGAEITAHGARPYHCYTHNSKMLSG